MPTKVNAGGPVINKSELPVTVNMPITYFEKMIPLNSN